MSLNLPKHVFFTKGKGFSKTELGSFEEALRNAGIEQFNLVQVSSILPPYCTEVSREEGLEKLQAGQIVFTVLSRLCSNEYNRLICASVGVAKPANKGTYGYLSEHHSFGVAEEKVGDFAEDLAAEMLATTLGIPFDVNANFDEKLATFKMDGRVIETKDVTQSAVVRKEGEYCTVIAAAVFII